MLLSQKSLKKAIHLGLIIKSEQHPKQIIKLENQKSASLDLTIGSIFAPNTPKVLKKLDLEEERLSKHTLGPGETILLEVNEQFNMPTDNAGIIFAPNHLTKKGIIMTNPGHIDPGFKGKITVCIVNMGRDHVPFKVSEVICRLLVFKLDFDAPVNNIVGKGVDLEQFNSLDKDFAAVSTRTLQLVSDYLNKKAPIFLGLLTIFITILALIIPQVGKYSLERRSELTIAEEMLDPLEEKLTDSFEAKLNKLQLQVEYMGTKLDEICKDKTHESCTNNMDMK